MGSSEKPAEEWYEEHHPPEDDQCKVIADPRYTTFSSYKFGFAGVGVYEVLKKTAVGDADPCSIEVQALECAEPCPGERCGRTYLHAVAIKGAGGESDHEVLLMDASCSIDGVECNTTADRNVGADGVKVVPYTPLAGKSPFMGEYGVGVRGWYVSAGGFKLNVTVTNPDKSDDAIFAMNVIASAPPMCTREATGLCTTTAYTEDTLLQAYAADYLQHHVGDAAGGAEHARGARGGKGESATKPRPRRRGDESLAALAPEASPVPMLPTYPSIDASLVMSGLSAIKCP